MDLIDRSKINFYKLTGPELVSAMEEAPYVPAVPLDKLCELLSNITVRTPCILCEKIAPEWCKEHSPRDCPTWEVILTKWMEEQDADRQ